MRSAIYTGHVSHRRSDAVRHRFRYPLFLAYVDLAEWDEVFDRHPLWSVERSNWVSLHRRDYLGDPGRSLDACVRDEVVSHTGARPRGPIALLTQPRVLGYGFNPVSFYFVFAPDGPQIEAIVVHVTNTPWGERHIYVLPAASGRTHAGWLRFEAQKQFHVSPFFDMGLSYAFRFRGPGDALDVGITCLRNGRAVFDADVRLARRGLTRSALTSALLRHPAQSLRLHTAIYWQAARLLRRGARFHPHPRHLEEASPT
ncbi:MAG: DUF1365 domain-containing protein [Proteobacteria bacterium]|nr:DUF1365 domain-containing protein [Pseudomonadota bacterium]